METVTIETLAEYINRTGDSQSEVADKIGRHRSRITERLHNHSEPELHTIITYSDGSIRGAKLDPKGAK